MEPKKMLEDIQKWLLSGQMREAMLAECRDPDKVSRFVTRLLTALGSDPHTLACAHGNFREMMRVLLPIIDSDLSFGTGIHFRASNRPNAKTNKHSFTAYITKWGTIEVFNRNPNLEVFPPRIVHACDEFEYYEHSTPEGDFLPHVLYKPNAHPDRGNEITGGFVFYRLRNNEKGTWRSGVLYMPWERMKAAASNSRNPDLYKKYPIQMYGNVLVRGLKHDLPMRPTESMGILDDDFHTPAAPAPEVPSVTVDMHPGAVPEGFGGEVGPAVEAPPPPPATKEETPNEQGKAQQASPPPAPAPQQPPAVQPAADPFKPRAA